MNPAIKLDILIAQFAYGGNGGISMISPDIMEWAIDAVPAMHSDPRIGKVHLKVISDTPLTMTRNRAVRHARELGAHLILMLDSDNSPTKHQGEPWHREFFTTAFNKIYDHYGKGPLVIGAPYCGPPNGTENVYVFQWGNRGVRGDETSFSLDQYTRAEAARMTGIQECAALPTGMILFDMRCFDLIEPSHESKRETLVKLQSGQITLEQAEWALRDGYFYYEYPNQLADDKASTEDVTCTRDISLAGVARLGYNPVMCAWDSWVGHHKPWNVGKPGFYGADQIAANFRKAILEDRQSNEILADVSSVIKLPKNFKSRQPTNSVIEEAGLPNWKTFHQTPEEDVQALRDLVKEVLSHKDKCRVLEVGTWLGNTAIAMADAGAEVHCVDTWMGTPSDGMGILAAAAASQNDGSPDAVYEEFLKRIGHRYHKSIQPYRMDSITAATACEWEPFDIIFIDADHTKKATAADIKAWQPHLAEDGIMCGHDYNAVHFRAVTEAVNEHFGISRVLQPGQREGNASVLGRTVWAVIPALEPAS